MQGHVRRWFTVGVSGALLSLTMIIGSGAVAADSPQVLTGLTENTNIEFEHTSTPDVDTSNPANTQQLTPPDAPGNPDVAPV